MIWIDGRMDGWKVIYEQMNVWTDAQTDLLEDGGMDARMDG